MKSCSFADAESLVVKYNVVVDDDDDHELYSVQGLIEPVCCEWPKQ